MGIEKDDRRLALLEGITDVSKPREYLLHVEEEIKGIIGKELLIFYLDNPSGKDIDRINELTGMPV